MAGAPRVSKVPTPPHPRLPVEAAMKPASFRPPVGVKPVKIMPAPASTRQYGKSPVDLGGMAFNDQSQ